MVGGTSAHQFSSRLPKVDDTLSQGALEVNDVHSQLNPTTVRRVALVRSVPALQQVVGDASDAGLGVAIAGGRHAMGGQQFRTDALVVDTTALCRPVDLETRDCSRWQSAGTVSSA